MIEPTAKSNRGRPSKTTRSIQVNCSLPEDIVTRMKLHLWSDAEGKVPHGSQSGLIEQALREYFLRRSGDEHVQD